MAGFSFASYASFASSERRYSKARTSTPSYISIALKNDVRMACNLRSFTASNPVEGSRVGLGPMTWDLMRGRWERSSATGLP